MNIRTVIFDLGRVLLWFDNDIFLKKLAREIGKSFEDVKSMAHGKLGLIRLFDGGGLTREEFHKKVSDVVGGDVGFKTFYELYNDIFWLNGPVLEIVRKLKRAGYTLILLSNTDPERFGFIRKRFPEIFLFDDYVLSYELKLLKPDPAIYAEAVRRAASKPEQCVFIDDRKDNVAGAKATGLEALHYLPETRLEEELRSLGLSF